MTAKTIVEPGQRWQRFGRVARVLGVHDGFVMFRIRGFTPGVVHWRDFEREYQRRRGLGAITKGKHMTKLAKWAAAVHDHCMKTGEVFTPKEAANRFGSPQSNVLPHEILETATRDGFFLRQSTFEGGHRIDRYVAIEHKPEPRAPDNHGSYFRGIKRVRSVFELGASL